MGRQRLLLGAVVVGLLSRAASAAEPSPDSPEFFAKKIQPVLKTKCFRCHSAAAKRLKAGLRLDSRAALLKGGESGPAFYAEAPAKSSLLVALRYEDEDLQMPPEGKLADLVIADFQRWLAAGARYGDDPKTESQNVARKSSAWWSQIGAADLLPPDQPIEQVIDHYVDARLSDRKIQAAPQAVPENLVRRLSLDLIGRIPTVSEARVSAATLVPDGRRAELVDRWMASPEFVEHQVTELSAFLMDGSGNLQDYLTRAVKENRSWDRIFRELLDAKGWEEETKGSDAFLRERVKNTDRVTNDVSVTFFGVNVSCAQCHDHPYVHDWTQERYYGMKSFFNRTFENGGFVVERAYGKVDYKTTAGDSRRARLMFLSGTVVDEPDVKVPNDQERKAEKKTLAELKKRKQPLPPPKFSRRAQLAAVALKKGEEYFFARAIVNRLWHRFLGRGLVMPLDQMHAENPPSHPRLLQWLARDLVKHGYDLRRLTRGIVMSRAYARESRWEGGARPAADLFAVALPRPLTPLQFGVSLKLASRDPESLAKVEAEELEKRMANVRQGARGLAGWFEQPRDDYQVSVDEALRFSNNAKVRTELLGDAAGGLIRRLLETKTNAERVKTAVWSVLSRAPDAEEAKILARYLGEREDRLAEACRQMVWSLMTSTEMRFNY